MNQNDYATIANANLETPSFEYILEDVFVPVDSFDVDELKKSSEYILEDVFVPVDSFDVDEVL
jgi:hypothetical protein